AGMLAVKCQWGGFGAPAGLFSKREMEFGIHGGDRETSMMLYFRPDTVDMAKAIDFPSTAESTAIPPIGPLSYGWVATDLNSDGTVGEANLATREKGKLTSEHQVAAFIALLRQVRDTSLGGLSPTIDGPR
ncbi:MAG: creatininase family protein, partial [Boseongicola sp.]